MADTLTVKGYLEKEDGTPEIRRFAVDQNVCASYTFLTSKIVQVFRGLQENTFSLYWKDSDNDLVSFSTDDELTDALGFVNDAVFRVYVRRNHKDSTSARSQQPHHVGVLCDACEGGAEIVGARFKCVTCPDYDLCAKCEAKGTHDQHDMLRTTTVQQRGWMGFGFMHQPPPHPHFHQGGPPPPPHHGPPPPPHGPCPPPHGGPQDQGGPGPTNHAFWAYGAPGWPWKRMMKRCWKRWMMEQYGAEGANTAFDTDSNCSEKPEQAKEADDNEPAGKEARMENESTQKEGNSTENTRETGEGTSEDQPPRDQNEAFLRNMGDSVAAMLDPLGIDVQVEVDHNGKRTSTGGRGGRGHRRGRGRGGRCGMGGPWGGWSGGGWGRHWASMFPHGAPPPGPWGPQAGPSNGAGPGGACGGSFSRQTSNEEKAADVEMSNSEPTNTDQQPTTPRSNQDVSMGSPAPHTEPSETGEWTVLEPREKDMNIDDKSGDGSAAQVPEPSTDTTRQYNPRLAEALEQMKAMGYSDDGGWLTSLLESKGGNINLVLDSLNNPRK